MSAGTDGTVLPRRTRTILKAEGAAIAAVAVGLYVATGAGWPLFAVLILAPDLTMVGYLRGPRVGAACYNAGHTYIAPAALAAVGAALGWGWAAPVALIWAVHIGGDRAIGYGLKDAADFHRTHLSSR